MTHGPDQLKPVPNVVEADRTTEVVVQVSVPPVALAPGASVFEFTETVAVVVQPFVPVTVTVYVPAQLTVGQDVFPPEIIHGPLQLYVPLTTAPA
jgi:hypothetical protein